MSDDWRPIETAPKDGTRVLLGAAPNHVDVGYWHEDKGRYLVAADKPYWQDFDNSFWWRFDTVNDEWFEPTRWMPMPEPPAA